MTDARMERIIGQLADFDEQELDIIVKKINIEREDRRQAKINRLIENFRKAWIDLSTAGVDICYCEDIDESCPLNIDNFEFYH